MSKKTLEGRIIRIPDESTVIINLGSDQGVTLNAIFSIFGAPETVTDPFSKENLGTVIVVKAKVAATAVYDRFTIASSIWTQTSLKGLSGGGLGGLFTSQTVGEKLTVDPTQIKPWLARSQAPVAIGDTVRTEVNVPDEKPKANPGAKTPTAPPSPTAL